MNYFQSYRSRFITFGVGCFICGTLAGFLLSRKAPAEASPVVEGAPGLTFTEREVSFDRVRGSKTIESDPKSDRLGKGVHFIDEERVLLPEKALKYFHAGAFATGPKLGADLIENLDLEPDDVMQIESAASNALEQIAAFEAEHAELRVDASGGEYYFVPSFGEVGRRIREELRSTVESTAGRGVVSLLMPGTKHSRTFADFGESARQLSIVEKKIEGGDSLYFFEQRFVRDDGTGSSSGSSRIFESDMEGFKQRYGRLFKELGDAQ